MDKLWPSSKEHAARSYSHKAILLEVVGARLAVNISHKQRLAHRNVLYGSGLDLPSAAPHILYGPPGIQYPLRHSNGTQVLPLHAHHALQGLGFKPCSLQIWYF